VSEVYSTCETCRFSDLQQVTDQNGGVQIGQMQRVCKRMPPAAVAIMAPGPNGVSVSLISTFPPVTDDMWCYEHDPENGAQDALDSH